METTMRGDMVMVQSGHYKTWGSSVYVIVELLKIQNPSEEMSWRSRHFKTLGSLVYPSYVIVELL